ncbi:MAG: hypothetical protein JXB07_04065 [Anaerolineae bacterium]|nr:hypothetical protein [Anaerolineae bacterium]
MSACASSVLADIEQSEKGFQDIAPSPSSVIALIERPSLDPSDSTFVIVSTQTLPVAQTPLPTLNLLAVTPYPNATRVSIGKSWENRDIWAWQFGNGLHTLVLIGGIHGGAEANTVHLADLLVSHFRQNPDDVLPGIRLLIIPVANPDGLARGQSLDGRLNAHQVDLNRNWGCEWADTAYLHEIPISPGSQPFSELETMVLRAFFLSVSPDAVLFYHSAAGGIFMGRCGDSEPGADWMGPLLDDATGYPVSRFTAYPVSGDATNWLAEQNIPAAVIELYSDTQPEFDRNLSGVMALQCHFALDSIMSVQPDQALQHRCDAYGWGD